MPSTSLPSLIQQAPDRFAWPVVLGQPKRQRWPGRQPEGKERRFLAVDSLACPTYTVRMATQLHDMDYLTDAERLLQSLRALVPHAVALAWTTRALEQDAKGTHALSRTVHNDHVAARRLDALSNSVLDFADHLKRSGFFNTLAHRSLLRSAVLFAQAACLVRDEDPACVPKMDPLWRSAADALSDIFKVV